MQVRTLNRILIASILMISFSATYAQITVNKLKSGSTEADGVVYNLPQTGFRVEIEITRTDMIKGPYAEYSDKYLGINNVIQYDNTTYNISEISITSFPSIDPNSYFLIQPQLKSKNKPIFSIQLSPEGFLSAISKNDNQDGSAKEKMAEGDNSHLPEIIAANYLEKVDTITRRIGRDTVLIEEKILKKSSTAKTPEQKAKEAADFIMKLDESMFNLINGYQEVNYEKGTMEFMYQEMNSLREAYLLQFKGITRTSAERYSFSIIPDAGKKVSEYQVARFSNVKGITDKDSNTGDKISLLVEDLNLVPMLYNQIEQRNEDATPGIVYRIPDLAKVSVNLGGKELLSSEFNIAQLGELKILPADLLGELEIYDNTGSVKRVSLR